MKYIDILVSQRHATNITYATTSKAPVCGNSDYTIRFSFDEEWDAYENKTARFVTENGYFDVLFVGNECPMPMLSNVLYAEVGVYAGDLQTSTPAYIPMDRSILCGDAPVHPEPPEDIYNQLLDRLNALEEATVSQSAIEKAVSDYLEEHPIEGDVLDPEAVEEIIAKYLEEHPCPGEPGKPGEDGEDGVSPTVSVTEIDGGHRLTISDVNGNQTVDILDGEAGPKPEKGIDYFTDEDKKEIAQMVDIDQIDAEKVYFSRDLETTFEIGTIKLSNGKGTVSSNGKNLVEVWDTIFLQEKNPSTTQPSVSLTFSQAGSYEVGTKVTPSYSATLKAGSYTYGPATGITASSWSVSDTSGAKKTTASGSFSQFTVGDNTSYKITAKATYAAGAIPVTNRGNPYSAGQIKAGSKSATSSAVSGYRNTFYGTLTAKTTVTSSVARGLAGKSEKALVNGSAFSVDIPVGALRVVIAYPATLRDVTSIKDVNGMGAEISSGFTKQTVKVEGANSYTSIDYKVYTMDFASANDTANTFDVII